MMSSAGPKRRVENQEETMPLCKFADRLYQLNCRYGYTPRACAAYTESEGEPDAVIFANEEELAAMAAAAGSALPDGYLEYLVIYKKICLDMLLHDGFLMHGSAIECDGRGIIFTAKSGVGKTTHTLLWQQEFGDGVRIINGDKPIIRLDAKGEFRIYGTPWNGKEHFGCNMSAPLRAICFLERDTKNHCEKMDQKEAVRRLMGQVLLPGDKELMFSLLRLVDRLIADVPVFLLHCRPDAEAAHVAFDAIVKGR